MNISSESRIPVRLRTYAHNLGKYEAQGRCSIRYLVKEQGKEERSQPAREGSTLLPVPGSEVKIIQKNIAGWLRHSCP